MQKFHNMANVEDYGEYYKVLSIGNNDLSALIKQEAIPLNNMVALLFREALNDNKLIRINKGFKNQEVMMNDFIILDGKEENEFTYTQDLYISKARQMVNLSQSAVFGIQVYDFIHINNYLCDKGFFIHDDNKEEMYLKILETGEETLIDKLEIYLNASDKIGRASALENEYQKYYTDISDAQSIEEIVKLYTKFKQLYDSYSS